jgi:hypothetical protein
MPDGARGNGSRGARPVLGAAQEDTMSTIAKSTHATKSTVTKSAASKSHATKSPAAEPAVSATPTTVTAEPAVAATPAPTAVAQPLQSRVNGAVALVKQAMVMLALTSPPLSAAQVKAATKFRKGGEAQIPTLAELSTTYGVEVPSRPTADMETNLAQAQLLAPLLALVVRFLATLESASFEVRSQAWATATTLYQMLRKASVREPTLKADLAPLEEFFAYRHPLVIETAPETEAKLAKAAKRQANAAKKLQRLQSAVAAKGGSVVSDAPVASEATATTPVATPAAAVATPGHS